MLRNVVATKFCFNIQYALPSIYVTSTKGTRKRRKQALKTRNGARLGRFGLDADASIENAAKAMAVTTGAIAHADAVTRSSVPDKCNNHHGTIKLKFKRRNAKQNVTIARQRLHKVCDIHGVVMVVAEKGWRELEKEMLQSAHGMLTECSHSQ
jgi:hypothetical protein